MSRLFSPTLLRKYRALALSVSMAALFLLLAWQTILAQGPEPLPPDLSTSTKSVDKDEAQPGDTLQYTVVISNGGDEPAAGVTMTDVLPAHVAYISGSIAVEGGGLYGVSSNVVTWTGAVNNSASIQISFSAILSESLSGGEAVTNTAQVDWNGSTIDLSAATTIVTDTGRTIFLPAIIYDFPIPPAPYIQPVGPPSADNDWTVTWSVWDATFIDEYEIQEARQANFEDATTIATTSASSVDVSKPVSPFPVYYYRVRAIGPGGTGPWSNVAEVVGNYRDDFGNGSTGWTIRRQDTDDIENYSYYNSNHFVMEIDGRWDYGIGAPMQPAPAGPYAIETSVRLNSADNLHSYGLIFGGDWDGTPCPNSDYSSCFNHYYRLNIIWFGSKDSMKVQLKRIERHDPGSNAGRGPELFSDLAVKVNPPPASYQVWRVEVYPSGLIKVFVNGKLVDEVMDDTFVDDPYFGVFASTDEYLGSEPWFDWYDVSVLP